MFSKHFRTFADWLGAQKHETRLRPQDQATPRAASAGHPSPATASPFAGHAKPLSKLKRTPSALVSPRLMTAKEQRSSAAAIDVAKEMRQDGPTAHTREQTPRRESGRRRAPSCALLGEAWRPACPREGRPAPTPHAPL